MPLNVWSLIFYLTQVEGMTWRQEDYVAKKITDAVKGRPVKGYFDITVGSTTRRFAQSNVQELMPILHTTVAHQLKATMPTPFDIVPIPNSDATVAANNSFKTLEDATAIAKLCGATALPALRWKKAKTPASKGGSRDPHVHFANLQIVSNLTRPFVIYDDVITTGSQLIAACWRLREANLSPVSGIVIGRTVHEQKSPAIGWHCEPLETDAKPLQWPTL